MGAMQNLKLQFSLVTFDVAMQKASNERNSIAFNRLHKEKKIIEKDPATGQDIEKIVPCLGQTGQKIYCKSCNIEIQNCDCTKGYEFQRGSFIEITDAELDNVRVETNGAIIIDDVVPMAELQRRPFMLTGSFYHLVPPAKSKYPDTSYALMYEALKGDQVAIGKTAMYGRTQAVAIIAGPTCFEMYMLRFPEEVRQRPQLALPPVDPSQVTMAKQIIKMLEKPEINLNYRDEYEEAKKKLIDNKLKGVVPAPLPQAAPTVISNNIEDMLRRSLEALQNKPIEPPPAPPVQEEPAAPAKATKAKKGGGKKGRAA